MPKRLIAWKVRIMPPTVPRSPSNGVIEAIDAETPMIVYPIRTDQLGNAARVAHHGLGRVGRMTDDADQIEAHLTRLLADPAVPLALARQRAAMHGYGDTRAAETTIRRLLENGGTT